MSAQILGNIERNTTTFIYIKIALKNECFPEETPFNHRITDRPPPQLKNHKKANKNGAGTENTGRLLPTDAEKDYNIRELVIPVEAKVKAYIVYCVGFSFKHTKLTYYTLCLTSKK